MAGTLELRDRKAIVEECGTYEDELYIYAEAQLWLINGDKKAAQCISTIRSAGIGGVQGDESPDYIAELQRDELAELDSICALLRMGW